MNLQALNSLREKWITLSLFLKKEACKNHGNLLQPVVDPSTTSKASSELAQLDT
jgi:hypothetical protein